MTDDKIPGDFIERQLRQSQYIAKKAVGLITPVCRNVWTTGGSVTAELRHLYRKLNVKFPMSVNNLFCSSFVLSVYK